MTIKIEDRRDYELYITKEVKHLAVTEGLKEAVSYLLMVAFDDGIRYANKDLKVKVNE